MRTERLLVVACLLLAACPERVKEATPAPEPAATREEMPPVMPVLVRLQNATDEPWVDAFVDEGSLRTFGAVAPGAVSEPLPLEWLSDAPRLGLLKGGAWAETTRGEGASRLAPARYVIEVRGEGEAPAVVVRREGPLPAGEELGEAFARAERALSPSLARAFVHLKRRDALACGSSLGVGGRARLRWFVAPSGRTGGVEVVSDAHKDTPVGECLVTAVKRWRFPRYTGEMPPAGEYELPLSP